MKKLILIFSMCIFYAHSNAQAVCCAPIGGWGIGDYVCGDGASHFGCCGKGDGWMLRGCNIGCCNCTGGCRVPETYDQCIKFCAGLESMCEMTCEENPKCIEEICKRDEQKCRRKYNC